MRQSTLRDLDTESSSSGVGQLLADRFRCSDDLAQFVIAGGLSAASGYFTIGSDIVCYGQSSSTVPARQVTDPLHDAGRHLVASGSSVHLPFDPAQVIESLRCEQYVSDGTDGQGSLPANKIVRGVYYLVRPLLPVAVRRHLQKLYFAGRINSPFPFWPVDTTVENIFEWLLVLSMKSQNVERLPFIWFWPDGAPSCTVVTHDVETSAGLDFCPSLMDLNDSFGIKTSFQVVPENRYSVSESQLEAIRKRGFEVNVHDLNHDGHLFRDWEEFSRRAERINQYGRQFGAQGFRSAVMYRRASWLKRLDFSYDMSVPNVAHFDPQRGGCCTVLPYFAGKLLELPLTTTQDYTLFNIFEDYSIRLWKQQIALIQEKHGLISFIIHPDYVIDQRARLVYIALLQHLCGLRERGQTWIALPHQVASWWRQRSGMNLVKTGGSWRIEGPGCERARIAYATLSGDQLRYSFASHPEPQFQYSANRNSMANA